VSRREAWLSAGAVFGIALLIRAWAATQATFPRPEDTAYYVDVAGNLLAGRGLTSDAIWSFGTPPLSFPRPAFEVWLPMATVLDLVPMAVLGSAGLAGGPLGSPFAAAQVASILVGSIVAVLAWRLAADVAVERSLPSGRARTLALGTGLAAAVYLPLVLFSVQPDSTMPFAALVLGGVLVMRRALDAVVVTPPPERPALKFSRRNAPRRQARRRDDPDGHGVGAGPRADSRTGRRWLVLVGLVLGLAALTRNEALWLALAWAIVAWWATRPARDLGRRARAALPLIGIPALVSIAVYAPWAIRDWLTFGSPLPGQALSNALFLDGRDVFAWSIQPTLERYLAAGVGTLLGLRVTGFVHNLGSVLLLLGVPISALGLSALPWTVRGATLRALAVFSLTTFLVATLVFPVSTTWGTFLHAAGAIHVLVLVSALLALDAVIARVALVRGWTRPVAWLGPTLAVAASLLISAVQLPADAAAGRAIAARYAALPGAVASAGAPLPADGSPVITDFPIWLAAETDVHAIALPNEMPADILDLAQTFGARLLIVDAGTTGQWQRIADPEELGAECFQPVRLPTGPLDGIRVFRIVCYGPTGPAPQ
jgi:hypothetical protein